MNELQNLQSILTNNGLISIINGIGIFMNIFGIIMYILMSWGLYQISKKLGVKYDWLSWVPILQLYNIIKCAGKSLWWILWIILIGILGLIIGTLIIGLFIYLIYSGIIQLSIILLSIIIFNLYIITFLLLYSGYIILLNNISKRTGRGVWTTIGFIFVPFIMFPIVGYKLKEKSETSEVKQSEENTPSIEEKITENKEEKIEL